MDSNETPRRVPETEYYRERVVVRNDDASDARPFRLDRSINVAVLLTLAGQLLLVVWFASAESAKIASNESRITALERIFNDNQAKTAALLVDLNVRLARIEEQVQLIPKR